jgi:hypothetical protein
MRLDEDKIEALRTWGEKLRQGGGDEAAAIGRAILMLVEEIDQLHIDLWNARLRRDGPEPVPTEAAVEDEEAPVASSLHGRLRRVLGRDSDSVAQPPAEKAAPPMDPEATTSAKAWLDALRSQK